MPRFLSCRSGDGSRTEHRIAGVASSTLFLLPHRKMTAVTARSVSWNSLLARQREASLRTEKRIGAVCWPNRLSQNLSRSSVATTVRSITVPRVNPDKQPAPPPPPATASGTGPHSACAAPGSPSAGLLSSSMALHRVVVSHAQVCAQLPESWLCRHRAGLAMVPPFRELVQQQPPSLGDRLRTLESAL